MYKKTILLGWVLTMTFSSIFAQEGKKFEQLGTMVPTPNSYRSASGAPGPKYWQQKANYVIDVEINDKTQVLTASEKITYFNQSPDHLGYLWVQLEQNMRMEGSLSQTTTTRSIRRDSIASKTMIAMAGASDYEGGFKIAKVVDAKGNALSHTINGTMMRIDLPAPLKPGENVTFGIDWSYNIYDRNEIGGRGGYEYFPDDDNYAYTEAQWFPRMAVYSDFEGWQNKQFMGRGEFALTFGDYEVNITVPSDHIIGATGSLQNPKDVLTSKQFQRYETAQKTYDKPVFIVTQEEAEKKEKSKSKKKSTWKFKAENVRDFAFASSRKYIWDAMAVKVGDSSPLAMSFYPKEGNPLWEKTSTMAIKNTLEVYSRYTIDYPYPVAQSVHAANQGMEYPMICFNYGRPKEDGTWSEGVEKGNISVIVHEVGHNFFPMIINSDERQWTWMDEGLNTFLEHQTMVERYSQFDNSWGTPKAMTRYMKGDKSNISPIMTNSEQVKQFGSNAYGKPSAAMVLLRETIMGPELFDKAFKTYAERWAFKHPEPADFFRTMEDASAVDLDWFWRGWFYGTDHVDITLDNVKWFKVRDAENSLEGKGKTGKIKNPANVDGDGNYADFSNGYEVITITDTDPRFYGEFRSTVADKAIQAKLAGKNLYELSFTNTGGLVSPIIIEWTFADGTSEREMLPAEIWRKDENKVTKLFKKDKEVTNIVIDPDQETGDVNLKDNAFPKTEQLSRFEKFGLATAEDNAKLVGEWTGKLGSPRGSVFTLKISEKDGKLTGTYDIAAVDVKGWALSNIYVGKGNIAMEFSDIGGKFEGTMVSDTQIKGKFEQSTPYELTLTKK